MRLLTLLVLLALTLVGCAPKRSEPPKNTLAANSAQVNDLAASMQRSMMVMQAAKLEAEQYCAAWRTREIPAEEEHAWGHERAVRLVKSTGPLHLEPKARTEWLAVVGHHLARASKRPELPWTFAIVESATPRVFSAAGGFVFVTTGLLTSLDNEAQLAGVVAHEIAHVAAKHELARYREAMQVNCVNARTMKAAVEREPSLTSSMGSEAGRFASRFGPNGSLVEGEEGTFLEWTHSTTQQLLDVMGNARDDEFAADADAAHLIAFAGYDVAELEAALRKLPQAQQHPPTADRVAKLEALRKGELAPFTAKAKPSLAPHTTGLAK